MSTPPETHGRHAAATNGNGRGHGGHGWLAMLACCIPMVAVLVLIALRVI